MTEIKRPNYFTSQFLIESDFNDEQKYHKEMRYRHHQSFHTWGVVKGLSVTKTGNNQVSIAAGMAVDNEGREIILVPTDPAPQPLVLSGAGDVYITIEYQEVRDESDKDKTSGIVDQYRRITERPLIKSVGAQPPNDGKVILLAKVEKLADGNFGEPDNNVRTFASAKIADGAITSAKIADGQISSSKIADAAITSSKIADGAIGTREIGSNSVTIDKLEPSIRPIASINGVSNPAGNVELVATNAITLVPNTDSKQIAIGESHSVLTDNPHGTTAAQVGALPISGGTLTGALTINGSQRNTQDFTAGPFALPRISGRVSVTGASAELSFTRRNLTAWPVTTAAGDRFVWYSPEGSARLFTEVKGDLLTIDKDGNVGIGTTSPIAKLQVSGGLTILEQEPWQTPILENGWMPYASEYNPPGYFKDSMGIVHLRGLVKSGRIVTAIFTLPIGYRPEFRNLFAVSTEPNAYARVDVATNGGIVPLTGSPGWISLDGITFRAFVVPPTPRIIDLSLINRNFPLTIPR